MKRPDLEHIIRAAGSIVASDDIVVVGSQAVLGQFPDAPVELLVSDEADVFPLHQPERSDLIDGAIGEGSPFERAFGYFAHGVDESTSILPHGWRDRLILIENENTRGVRGWCLEVHDLAIAKLIAGREKDFDFLAQLLRYRLADPRLLRDRLAITDVDPVRRKLTADRLQAAIKNTAT